MEMALLKGFSFSQLKDKRQNPPLYLSLAVSVNQILLQLVIVLAIFC